MQRSLTFRLTFLFAHVSAALLLGLGLLVNNLVERHFDLLDRENLAGKLELAQKAFANVREADDLKRLPIRLETALVGHPGVALVIFSNSGQPLYRAGDTTVVQELLKYVGADAVESSARWNGTEGSPYRMVSAAVTLSLPDFMPATAAVALDLSHHESFIAGFKKTLWTSVIAAALLAGVIGRMAVQRGLAPLREIEEEASRVTAHRLAARIAVDSVPAELGTLVQTLNSMFGRLEESFCRLSDFSADLAHELRTPVSNLLMQTQVVLSKPRSAEQYKEALYSNVEEFSRLSRMISEMLFLAKAEHGLIVPSQEQVELAEEVQNLFSFFEVLAEAKNVRLTIEGSGAVTGDRMLLRRALSNVISNGIRYAQESGTVRVRIVRTDENLVVCVENTGETIPGEHIPRLFDRFYRADPSRQGASEGAGLGLAITKSIITLHGGTIGVDSQDGITRFEISFPQK